MFKKLFQSIKKSRQLKTISLKLSRPITSNYWTEQMLYGRPKFKKNEVSVKSNNTEYIGYVLGDVYIDIDAVDELIYLVESDKYIKRIMDEYNANQQTLKELYKNLIFGGAGKYINSHFVAASSLVHPTALKFLLKHYNGYQFSIKNYDHNSSRIFIIMKLFEFFENGENESLFLKALKFKKLRNNL